MRRAAAALLLARAHGRAGGEPANPPPGPPGSELTVFLMTMGPGRQVWERFGHNAIWIHDPIHGTDQAYNYGLFDFHQQNFLLRFIRARCGTGWPAFPPSQYVCAIPSGTNRSVWVQELELTARGPARAAAIPEWNEEPEHRFYHYDYYRDNCSTRVRDALDRVLGGAIRTQTVAIPAGTTYRFHTQRLTANDPLIIHGPAASAGPGVDRPISAWEEMFLPLKMREHVRRVHRVPGQVAPGSRWSGRSAPCSNRPAPPPPMPPPRGCRAISPSAW